MAACIFPRYEIKRTFQGRKVFLIIKPCLIRVQGDIITVIRRIDENWAEGKLDDRIGMFPISFVEMNHHAKNLMKATFKLVFPTGILSPYFSSELKFTIGILCFYFSIEFNAN